MGARNLPHPLHIFRFLTNSNHYHFGLFETGDESIALAMDRIVERAALQLPAGERILDLGCGIGGTAIQLSKAGFDVTAIDPDARLLEFARADNSLNSPPTFFAGDLRTLVSEKPGSNFGGMVMTEVLQHYPALDDLFEQLSHALHPQAVVVFNDLALVEEDYSQAVPFHRVGKLLAHAGDSGFRVRDCQDLTPHIQAMPKRLLVELERQSESLHDHFRLERPRLSEEIEEFTVQLEHLQRALVDGQLLYQSVVLDRSTGEHV